MWIVSLELEKEGYDINQYFGVLTPIFDITKVYGLFLPIFAFNYYPINMSHAGLI